MLRIAKRLIERTPDIERAARDDVAIVLAVRGDGAAQLLALVNERELPRTALDAVSRVARSDAPGSAALFTTLWMPRSVLAQLPGSLTEKQRESIATTPPPAGKIWTLLRGPERSVFAAIDYMHVDADDCGAYFPAGRTRTRH
jgi:hypothetical protein